jgi:hypothetical protein
MRRPKSLPEGVYEKFGQVLGTHQKQSWVSKRGMPLIAPYLGLSADHVATAIVSKAHQCVSSTLDQISTST